MKNILIIFMAFGLASAELDLKRSVDRITAQIEVTKTNVSDWTKLPVILDMAMNCLVNGVELVKVKSNGLPSNLNYIESVQAVSLAQALIKVDWTEVSAKRSSIEPNADDAIWEDLKAFMKTPKFDTIHNHLWKNPEFLDLLELIRKSNYATLYEAIKQFYTDMERSDLVGDIGPPTAQSAQAARRTANAPKIAASTNFPEITFNSAVISADPKCNLQYLLSILQVLNQSNIHHVIKIFFFAFQEFIGNAAMHVLVMKVAEPQKGELFDSTLALPEMSEMLPLVHRLVLQEPNIVQINEIVRQLTGLTIENMELFKYVISLIKYILWNHPFPA